MIVLNYGFLKFNCERSKPLYMFILRNMKNATMRFPVVSVSYVVATAYEAFFKICKICLPRNS